MDTRGQERVSRAVVNRRACESGRENKNNKR
jgi:hypothetical protein